MQNTGFLIASFILLGLSVCAVWAPALRLTGRPTVPLWLVVFILAAACGLVGGNLSITGIVGLIVFSGAAYLASRPSASRTQQILLGTVTAILALALALHKMPGFHNPQIISAIRFSPDAAPFTHYANFDKGAAGLVLLAFFCRRSTTGAEWASTLSRAVPVFIGTSVVVFATGYLLRYAIVDLKVPAETGLFLLSNLFFVATAEEAFFRGFLQERLQQVLGDRAGTVLIAVAASAVLFGLAHSAGGPKYVVLAGLAGVGYAYAYSATRRIESSIFVHVALNATHFFAFTYPYLANQTSAA